MITKDEVLGHINGHLSAFSELLHDTTTDSKAELLAIEVMTRMIDDGYAIQDMELGLEAMLDDILKSLNNNET